jgi:hypothetical protein
MLAHFLACHIFFPLQWLLGKRKLTVDVNYANIPLAYQYLNQYHNMPIPGAGTPLGDRINIPRSVAPQLGPWYTPSLVLALLLETGSTYPGQ